MRSAGQHVWLIARFHHVTFPTPCLPAQVLRTLHSAGADVNQQASSGCTALHYAVVAAADPPAVAAYLLAAGADDTIADAQGMLPLHVACDAGAGLPTI